MRDLNNSERSVRFHWHRLLVNPKTRVLSQQHGVTQVHVDGLVCSDVCAVRTREALEALPGVTSVSVDFDSGVATILGESHDAPTYERAVTGAVALRPLRRAIESIARRGRRPTPGEDGATS